jgi:hypothetical protein
LRIEELDFTLSHIWPPFEDGDQCQTCATSRSITSGFDVVLGSARGCQITGQAKLELAPYMAAQRDNQSAYRGDPMAFKPNYGRDRAERQRAARARTEDKQKKREQKAALRKAERDAVEAPANDKQD